MLALLISVLHISLLVIVWKTDCLRNDKYVFVLSNCMNLRGLLFLPYSFHFFPGGGVSVEKIEN